MIFCVQKLPSLINVIVFDRNETKMEKNYIELDK